MQNDLHNECISALRDETSIEVSKGEDLKESTVEKYDSRNTFDFFSLVRTFYKKYFLRLAWMFKMLKLRQTQDLWKIVESIKRENSR